MAGKVADASAILSIIFKEPERAEIARRLEGARLVAPALLWFEIANSCVAKMRRHPEMRAGIFDAFLLQTELAVETAHVDHTATLLLAERTGLTGYDASYLWLAQELDAELVSLDRPLLRAAAALGLRVTSAP